LHAQAFRAFEQGNFTKAIGLWKKGIKKCKKLNNPQLTAKLYLGLGMGHAQDTKYIKALSNFQSALELYKQAGNIKKQAHSLFFIGKMYLKLENYETSLKNYNSALNISKQIKDKELTADILFDIGETYNRQGKYNKSMNIFRQVLKIYKKLEKNSEVGEVLFEMGKVLRKQGSEHYQEAYKNFKNALKIIIKENQQKNEIECRNEMGDLLLLLGQPQDAFEQYKKAFIKSRTNKYVIGEISAYFGQGKALFELKKYKESIGIFNSVLQFYQKIKYLKGEISSLTYLSNSYEKIGDKEKAEKFKKLAQNVSKKLEKSKNNK